MIDLEALARVIDPRATRSGNSFKIKCPCHEDAHASASLTLSDDGNRLLARCHAGCDQRTLFDTIRSRAGSLMNGDASRARSSDIVVRQSSTASTNTSGAPAPVLAPADAASPNFERGFKIDAHTFEQSWRYTTTTGEIVGHVARYRANEGDGKTIRPIVWTGQRWKFGAMREPRPLLNAVSIARDRRPLLVVEGEKCVDVATIAADALVSTTWAGGASAVDKSDWSIVHDRKVLIWPDHDAAGFDAARAVAAALANNRCEIRFVVPEIDRPRGWDIADAVADNVDVMQYARARLSRELPDRFNEARVEDLPDTTTRGDDDGASLNEFLIFSQEEIARYLVSKIRDHARHWTTADRWYFYEDGLWRVDRSLRTIAIAREVAMRLAQRALDDHPKEGRKLARALASSGGIYGGVKIARTDQTIQIDGSQFDSKRNLICTPSGTFDVVRDEFRENQMGDMCSLRTAVAPDFSAPPRRWLRFLLEVFGGNRRIARFVRHALGYALTGFTHIHALFFLHGHGRNGKSTLAETFQHIAGDYAHIASHDFLMSSGGEKHPTEIAALVGKRAVMCNEVGEGSRWNDVRVKELTGSARVRARFMRQDGFEFERVAKMFILGNTRPTFSHIDPAFEARIKLIPFNVSFQGRENFTLGDELREESARILADLLRCAARVHRHGLPRCPEIELASSEYLSEMDDIKNFMDDCAEPVPFKEGAPTSSTDLHVAFNLWRSERGMPKISDKRFYERMRARYEPTRSARWRGYAGVTLTQEKAVAVRRYQARQREQHSPRSRDNDIDLINMGINPEGE